MELKEVFEKRYSVRNFKGDKIPQAVIDELLDVVTLVPTAKNMQPFHLHILDSEDAVLKIRSITKSAYNAPTVLMITRFENEEWVNPYNNERYGMADCSILTTYLMLKATELGLGSVFVGWFNEEKIQQAFPLKEGERVVALLPIGYIHQECKPSENHYKSKTKEELISKF